MAQGLSLAIGLNSVDPEHYSGWSGDLNACEADAEDMAEIGSSKGFQVKTLLTRDATIGRVTDEISRAAGELKSGDMFLLSYSGHGGQLPDLNSDEIDGYDETWCLYDGELVDDQLYDQLARFPEGVRILMFSDSCHSGSVASLKEAYYSRASAPIGSALSTQPILYRAMPGDVARRVYRVNKDFYDAILKDPKIKDSREAVKASVILISGCQDNQLSQDGEANGLFTANMLAVWRNGAFEGNYRGFHRAIVKRMPPDQTPNYFRVGKRDPEFEKQKPFTI